MAQVTSEEILQMVQLIDCNNINPNQITSILDKLDFTGGATGKYGYDSSSFKEQPRIADKVDSLLNESNTPDDSQELIEEIIADIKKHGLT